MIRRVNHELLRKKFNEAPASFGTVMELTGLKPLTLHNMMAGNYKSNPRPFVMRGMCQVFGVSEDELFPQVNPDAMGGQSGT